MAQALGELHEALRGTFGPRLVKTVLFGSFARGEVHEESDVDVLVMVDPREPRDGHRAVDDAVSVMLRHPDVVISPLVMTPAELDELRRRELRLASEIDAQGIAL